MARLSLSNTRLEIIKFLIAGGSCLIFELFMLYTLTELLDINYLISAAIAFTLSVAVNYKLCANWVFKTKENQRSLSMKFIFFTLSIAGLGINQLCMWIFVEYCGFYYMLAKLVSAVIVTIWNFITKRLVLTQ